MATTLTLYGALDEQTGPELARKLTELLNSAETEIELLIHSYGGDALGGLQIANKMRELVAKGKRVTTVIEGVAASAASVVAIAGRPVRMARNAQLMIHNPWQMAAGDAAELESLAKTLRGIEADYVAEYQARTQLPAERIAEMMSSDTWMSAAQAQALGFVDEVVEPVRARAESSAVGHCKDLFNQYSPHNAQTMSNPTTTENDAVVTALRQEKEKLQAELDELKKQHREAEAGAAVDAAVAAGKIRKEQAPHFKSLYLADASTTKALLDSMQPAAPASILAQTRPGSSATATVPAARADWTIRRWEQEDPEGLRRLMQENPEAYWAMYNAFYPKR